MNPQADDIATFIQRRGVFQRDERLAVRLIPDSRTPVELTCEYEFLVRNLNTSGMRIETALQPSAYNSAASATAIIAPATGATPNRRNASERIVFVRRERPATDRRLEVRARSPAPHNWAQTTVASTAMAGR